MKTFTFLSTLLMTLSALAISSSTPVGEGSSSYNQLRVRLYQQFSMADGNVVQEGSISQISYRNVIFGGQSMLLKVNGDIYKFNLGQYVSIENGYASAAGSTSASNTGQGIGVIITENPRGGWNTYTELETKSCTGSLVRACIYVDGVGEVCDTDYPTGRQTDLVEYGNRTLNANVRLITNKGNRLADIGYDTKEFRKITLEYEYYPCDANNYENVRATRRAIRQRLREQYAVDFVGGGNMGGGGHGGKIKGH